MSDNDLVERVARAIFVAVVGDDNGRWEEMDEYERADYRTEARAAIEAMREPTQKMRLAGIAEWARPDPSTEHGSTLIFNAIWRVMIDAALEKDAANVR